jgi:hypothetical protein
MNSNIPTAEEARKQSVINRKKQEDAEKQKELTQEEQLLLEVTPFLDHWKPIFEKKIHTAIDRGNQEFAINFCEYYHEGVTLLGGFYHQKKFIKEILCKHLKTWLATTGYSCDYFNNAKCTFKVSWN